VRGVQLRQGEVRGLDRVEGYDVEFDTDVVSGDKLGGFPTFVGPDGWDATVFG
jgi:hypothetical protein